jgi:hypothetical protein
MQPAASSPTDLFGILIAVILGIIYTIRKLDVRRREASEFPAIDAGEFERWRKKELFAYNLASFACVLKVLIDVVMLSFRGSIPWTVVRVVGAGAFFGWVLALVASLVLGSSARKLRERLGIDLRAHDPSEADR